MWPKTRTAPAPAPLGLVHCRPKRFQLRRWPFDVRPQIELSKLGDLERRTAERTKALPGELSAFGLGLLGESDLQVAQSLAPLAWQDPERESPEPLAQPERETERQEAGCEKAGPEQLGANVAVELFQRAEATGH
jgi:hypothetical protein